MQKRPVIIHCHLFKNAGSTIDTILRNNFSTAAVALENEASHFIPLNEIIATAEATPQIKAISSHRMGIPTPKHDIIKFIPLIMLRDPLDRIGSIYSFYRRQTNFINHLNILACQKSFREFVQILLESETEISISNFQAQFFLQDTPFFQFPSEGNWHLIENNIAQTVCLGIVDKFDESMVLWEGYLQHYFPNIDLTYTKQNISAERPKNLQERIVSIKKELGEYLVSEIQRINKFDYLLYNLANRHLDDRIANHQNFHEQLTAFKDKTNKMGIEELAPPINIGAIQGSQQTNNHHLISFQKRDPQSNVRQLSIPRILKFSKKTTSDTIKIVGVTLLNKENNEPLNIVHHNQRVEVIVCIIANKEIPEPIVGFTVTDNLNTPIFSLNSFIANIEICPPIPKKLQTYSFQFRIPPLNQGSYAISPAFASGTQESHNTLCSVRDAYIFYVPKMIESRFSDYLFLKDFTFSNE